MHTLDSNYGEEKQLLRQMHMYSEETRLETFKDWVFDGNQRCNASRMAESGFYFIGSKDEPDAVQCFLCAKNLDNWDAKDDPWDEHFKHAPHCDFAKSRTPESALTLNQFVDLKHQQTVKIMARLSELIIASTQEKIDAINKAVSDILN